MIMMDIAKKTRFDFVLTAVSPNLPNRLQMEAIFKWIPAIGTVVVHGHMPHVANRDGVEFLSSENPSATLYEMLKGYMARNPVDDVVAICNPSIVLAPNPAPLFEFMESTGTGRAWGFYSKGPALSAPPELFVTTTVVISHLLKAVPTDLNMEGDGWALWLDEWFGKNLPLHRYVDATKYQLVEERVAPPLEPATILSVNTLLGQTLAEIAQARPWARVEQPKEAPRIVTEAVSEPIVDVSPKAEVKVAKKRGRPRKALKTFK